MQYWLIICHVCLFFKRINISKSNLVPGFLLRIYHTHHVGRWRDCWPPWCAARALGLRCFFLEVLYLNLSGAWVLSIRNDVKKGLKTLKSEKNL